MPVLESTDEITPRSALRHRPIGDKTASSGTESFIPTSTTPAVQRASRARPRTTDVAEDVSEWQSGEADDTGADRKTTKPQRVKTTSQKLPKAPSSGRIQNKRKSWQGAHPLLYLGVGMIAMLALWTLLTSAMSWWNTTWDDLHYGRPRTFQIDALVGHNETTGIPSHFIAMNLNGRIEIIEFPGGDGSKARIYLGPQLYGTGDDLIPVTLSFADVNGDHLPDMIIHFQSSRIVFINDHGGFRPLRPEERVPVQQFLQRTGQ
ncbi:MAG TPA: hypothetical protein VN954_15065 [Ktedonobacteraceae bacterium]|nr:hypothetical protein [Ktedonobacteraceae bacterium]